MKDELSHHRALKKLSDYESIGTVEEFKALKDKETPTRAELIADGYYNGQLVYDEYVCPNCNAHYELDYEEYKYCPKCGQQLIIN
jgi:DNA-directed RNA polymerase subunit RPC12/RpoP